MNLLLGRRSPYLVKTRLRDRVRCWLRGGHDYYFFNGELGGLWCYDCQSIRQIKTEGWSAG